jgi:hypothetical protein
MGSLVRHNARDGHQAGDAVVGDGRSVPECLLYAVLYMASTRTQIYLTDDQRRLLDARGRRTGKPLARMIREAVDQYLADTSIDADEALSETFGSVPDLELPSRDHWDRDAYPGR